MIKIKIIEKECGGCAMNRFQWEVIYTSTNMAERACGSVTSEEKFATEAEAHNDLIAFLDLVDVAYVGKVIEGEHKYSKTYVGVETEECLSCKTTNWSWGVGTSGSSGRFESKKFSTSKEAHESLAEFFDELEVAYGKYMRQGD